MTKSLDTSRLFGQSSFIFLKNISGLIGNILSSSVIRHIVQVHRRDSGTARQFQCNAGQHFIGLKMLNTLKFDPFSEHFTEQDNGFLGKVLLIGFDHDESPYKSSDSKNWGVLCFQRIALRQSVFRGIVPTWFTLSFPVGLILLGIIVAASILIAPAENALQEGIVGEYLAKRSLRRIS